MTVSIKRIEPRPRNSFLSGSRLKKALAPLQHDEAFIANLDKLAEKPLYVGVSCSLDGKSFRINAGGKRQFRHWVTGEELQMDLGLMPIRHHMIGFSPEKIIEIEDNVRLVATTLRPHFRIGDSAIFYLKHSGPGQRG